MKFSKYTKSLKAREGKAVHLSKYDTSIKLLYNDDEDYQKNLDEFNSELQSFQEKHFGKRRSDRSRHARRERARVPSL
jgi:hypothetical protein